MTFVAITIAIFILLFFASIYVIRVLGKARLTVSLKQTMKEGATQEAIRTLLKIIRKNPADGRSRMELVKLYMEEKAYGEAIGHLRLLLEGRRKQDDFDRFEAEYSLGSCHLSMGKTAEALRVYASMEEAYPDEPRVFAELGKIAQIKGDAENAARYFDKVISLDPGNVDILQSLAQVFFDSGKYQESAAVLQRIVEKDPGNSFAHFTLGQVDLLDNRHKEAFSHFLKSKDDRRFAAKSLLCIGTILRRYNKVEEAKKVLLSVVSRGGLDKNDLHEGMYELAEIHFQQREIRHAIALWKRILSSTKEYRDVRSKLEHYEPAGEDTMLQKYITSSRDEFAEMCKKITAAAAGRTTIIRTSLASDATVEILVQGVYKEIPTVIFFKFFRGSANIGQLVVREFYEKLRESKAKRGVCITSTEYTEDALAFSEGRMLDLLDGKALVKLLARVKKFEA